MTTEPFSPESGVDRSSGTAPIVPVTPDMMDHAAHVAAEQVEAVSHEASVKPSDTDAMTPAPVETAAPEAEPSLAPEIAVAANENATAAREAVATPGSGAPQAADLTSTHGATRIERTVDRASHTVAASFDGFGLFNAKVVEIAATNVAAAGELVSALLAAKTVPEAAAVNAQYMRRTFETFSSQGRELMVLGQKVVLDAARPSGERSRKL